MEQRIVYARVSTEDQHLDLQRSGIGFESLTEKIEMNSAEGKLVFYVFAALAEFERDLIRERIHVGRACRSSRERPFWRP